MLIEIIKFCFSQLSTLFSHHINKFLFLFSYFVEEEHDPSFFNENKDNKEVKIEGNWEMAFFVLPKTEANDSHPRNIISLLQTLVESFPHFLSIKIQWQIPCFMSFIAEFFVLKTRRNRKLNSRPLVQCLEWIFCAAAALCGNLLTKFRKKLEKSEVFVVYNQEKLCRSMSETLMFK